MLSLPIAARPTSSAVGARSSAAWLAALLHAGDPSVADRVALATPASAGWHELTYADLDHSSAAVAAWLVRKGVAPGERVLLQGDPSGAWVSACLGILRGGAIAVPLDPRITAGELAPIVDASAPSAAAVTACLRPLLDDVALDVDVLELESLERLADTLAPTATTPGAARTMDDPAFVVWTSGSTGRPKGVTLTYANLAYAVSRSAQVQGLDGDDRWLSVLPLNHVLALSGLLASLRTGATLSFCPTLMPREVVELLDRRRITRMMVVPLLARLLQPELERFHPDHLAAAFVGGAPLAPELADAYAALGIPLYQGYGMTETAATVAMNSPEHHRRASVGRPLPGTEVRIDHDRERTGDGDDGEIMVRSPAVMAGYWNDDALTAASIDAGGWLHTGDLGHLDDDGFLFVTGRAKDLIALESGKKVQPEEVEAALRAGTRFAEVCVVGVAPAGGRSAGGEQVCAVVVPACPLSDEEAYAEVARLSAGLSGYKRPRLVDLLGVDASLPTTAKRSVRRPEVARQAAARLHGRLLVP